MRQRHRDWLWKSADPSRRVHAARLLVLPALIIALAPACGGDDESGVLGEGGSKVDVTLQEFAVGTVPASAPAGSVTFDIVNNGPDDEHEFVVFRTDLDPTALPTVETGAVDEEGEGLELVDEVEAIQPGDTATLTLDLEAGSYVFICNIYDEAESESHYQEGMRTSFTIS